MDILEVEPIVFRIRLDIKSRKRKVNDNFKNFLLSCRKNVIAIH